MSLVVLFADPATRKAVSAVHGGGQSTATGSAHSGGGIAANHGGGQTVASGAAGGVSGNQIAKTDDYSGFLFGLGGSDASPGTYVHGGGRSLATGVAAQSITAQVHGGGQTVARGAKVRLGANSGGGGSTATGRHVGNSGTRSVGPASLTRTASSSRVTIAAGTAVGTDTAHPAFPFGVQCENGDTLVFYTQSTAHGSTDQRRMFKRRTAGVWGPETQVPCTDSASAAALGVNLIDLAMARAGSGGRIHGALLGIDTTGTPYKYYTYYVYSDDNGHSWSTPVQVTFGLSSGRTVPNDVLELADGSIIVNAFGDYSPGTTWGTTVQDTRCSRSSDHGATWADVGVLGRPGSFYGHNVVEAQFVCDRDGSTYGTIYATFHLEDGGQTVYTTKSTDGGTTWALPLVFATGDTNRSGLELSPDGDLILGHFPVGGGFAFRFNQSFNKGATWGSNQDPNAGESAPLYPNDVWISPFNIAGAGVSPNLAMVWALENSPQNQSIVYYREFATAAVVTSTPGPGVRVNGGGRTTTNQARALAAAVHGGGDTHSFGFAAPTVSPREFWGALV